MNKSAVISLVFLFSSLISAKEIRYPAVIMTKVSDSIITFEQCYTEKTCRSIGQKNGYSIDDLNFSPNARKSKAVAIGTGELVVGAMGGWMAGWAAWGAGAAGGVMWTTTAATGAAISTAPSLIDELNPVLQWKMADVEAKIHKDNLSNDDRVVIEISDDIQMVKFVKTLNKVLADIK